MTTKMSVNNRVKNALKLDPEARKILRKLDYYRMLNDGCDDKLTLELLAQYNVLEAEYVKKFAEGKACGG